MNKDLKRTSAAEADLVNRTSFNRSQLTGPGKIQIKPKMAYGEIYSSSLNEEDKNYFFSQSGRSHSANSASALFGSLD